MPWLRNISWVLKLKERCIFHFPKITTDCTASPASLGNVSSHGGFNTSHRTGNHNMWGDYDSTITIHTSNRQTRSLKNTGTWPYLSPDRAALTSLSLSLSLYAPITIQPTIIICLHLLFLLLLLPLFLVFSSQKESTSALIGTCWYPFFFWGVLTNSPRFSSLSYTQFSTSARCACSPAP